MKPFENETEFAAALREMRPTPRPEFAAELDQRAAGGFPRDSRRGKALAALREWLASSTPRRLIVPAGAFAVAAVVIATAVVAMTESGNPASGGGAVTATSGGHSAGGGHPQVQLDQAVPPVTGKAATPPRSASGAGSAPSSGSTEASATEFQRGVPSELPRKPSGPYASQARRRDVERSADIVLGAEPAEVRADAAKVFDAVHAADGTVLSSSIRDGKAGDAGAEFELLIPSAKLGDALAALSRVAEVRSRHESTEDITAPTVSIGERLRDSRARVESLLGQLVDASSDGERAAVEAQLRAERYRVAALRSRLSSLERRASFSRISLRIETGEQSTGGGSGAGWGIDDGLDDAGRILAIAAGVTVIGLAILIPFALIAMLAWLTRRAWIRRARRDALARV